MTDTCALNDHPEVRKVNSIAADFTNLSPATTSADPILSTAMCHLETPFLTQVKILGAYTFPWDVRVSGTWQGNPGPPITANAVFTSAQVAQSLGRPLSSAATVTTSVVQPGTLYGERRNQVDVRFAKIFRLGPTRMEGQVDFYNVLNNNTVTIVNNTYGTTGTTWQVPLAILPARLVKFGVQVNF
jgi:hypothetical protein